MDFIPPPLPHPDDEHLVRLLHQRGPSNPIPLSEAEELLTIGGGAPSKRLQALTYGGWVRKTRKQVVYLTPAGWTWAEVVRQRKLEIDEGLTDTELLEADPEDLSEAELERLDEVVADPKRFKAASGS